MSNTFMLLLEDITNRAIEHHLEYFNVLGNMKIPQTGIPAPFVILLEPRKVLPGYGKYEYNTDKS